MENQIKLIIGALLLTANSYAGGVGNGGGGWVCRNQDQSVRWVRLVDLFEAQEEFGLELIQSNDEPEQQFQGALARLAEASPKVATAIVPFIEHVQKNWPKFGSSELEIVDDYLHRRRPDRETCSQGTIAYEQIINFTDDNRILGNLKLYDKPLSKTEKAALWMHEALYALLRNRIDERNSNLTRKLVGYLFSTKPTADYAGLFPIRFLPRTGYYGDVSGKYCGKYISYSKTHRIIEIVPTVNPWDPQKVPCGTNYDWHRVSFDPTKATSPDIEWGGTQINFAELVVVSDEEIALVRNGKATQYFWKELR